MKTKFISLMIMMILCAPVSPLWAKETKKTETGSSKEIPCDPEGCVKTKPKDSKKKATADTKKEEIPEDEDVECPTDCGKPPYKIEYPHPDRNDNE